MTHCSYAITFRPRSGVTDPQCSTILNWARKSCTYYYVITEKEDDARHVHAALFLKKATSISNLATTLTRLFPSLSSEELAVFRKGIKSMYNKDFLETYMQKGDSTVVLATCLPEMATLDSYFADVPNPKKRGPSHADPYYANLEKLWFEHKRPIDECNPENLRHFLMAMMNKKRLIRVISDNRKIFQLSCSLSRYINKEESFNVEPDQFHQDK